MRCINLLDEFDTKKEFGLGSIEKNGKNITFNLKPIDVIMVKYSKNKNNNKNYSIVIVSILISLIIIIIVAVFIVKKYIKNKNETNNFVNSTTKLINDN